MRMPLWVTQCAGWAALSAALMTAVTLSACGSGAASPGAAGQSPGVTSTATTPAAITSAGNAPSHPASTGPAGTTPAGAPSAAEPGSAPAGGPVPGGFAATSVTFVSPEQAFALGTAPCSHKPCTSIVRTLDRGASWRGLPALVVPLGQLGGGTSPAVWGIRFATPLHGFVFGTGLWETTDGGEHWALTPGPAGVIASLEVIDGQVLALAGNCSPQYGCGQSGVLTRRPLSGGAWHTVATVRNLRSIATQARVAAVLDGTNVIVTGDGGLTKAEHTTPCATPGVAMASQVAVTGPGSLALLCSGQGYTGNVTKVVYISGDLGAHWTKAGTPAPGGDPAAITGGSVSRLVVAAESGASWLYYSSDSGARWGTAYLAGDGGMGWNDLGFTTASDGVAVHGPALTDGNPEGRTGQLLLTSDGGATWHAITW